MIKNGLGILSVPIDLIGQYFTHLIKYYETNDNKELKEFLLENCIDGI